MQINFYLNLCTKGYLRETYKSQNINSISSTPKFNLRIIQNIIKSLSTISKDQFNKKKYLAVHFQNLTIQPNQEVRGVCKVKMFCFYVGLYFFPFNFFLTFQPQPHGSLPTQTHGSRVCIRTECVLAWCSAHHSL